jgi:hypothetical protein
LYVSVLRSCLFSNRALFKLRLTTYFSQLHHASWYCRVFRLSNWCTFKIVKIYIKIYMRCAATCFGFSQPSTWSYCMCFAKVVSINNQLKYVVYRISSV